MREEQGTGVKPRLLEVVEIAVLVRAAHKLDILLLVEGRAVGAHLEDVDLDVVVAQVLQAGPTGVNNAREVIGCCGRLQDCRETVAGQLWNGCRRLWNGCGPVAGQLWNGCGMAMERSSNEYGTVMERFWYGYGTVLERLRNGNGTVMERLWNDSGTWNGCGNGERTTPP